MASKKKKEAQEWFQCMKCGQVIYRTDTAQHVDSCTATPTFVLDSVLHAHLTTTKTSQIKASLDKMSFASRDGVVLIHRSTMAMCGLCIGQPCLVNGRHVLTSWPCDGLPPTSVYLPPLLLDVIVGSAPGSDCVVTVKCFRPSGSEAQHVDVELELENPKSLSELSVQAFAFKMEGQYITEDMRHTIRLLGRPCTFHIRTIQTVKHPVFQLNLPSPSPFPPQPSHTEELSQDLSSLNLSNYGDNSMSSLPATPLRQAGEDTPSTHSPAVSTPSVETPAVSTPKQSNSTPKQSDMQRSDQFHTPASQTSPPSGEEDTRHFVKVTCRTQFRFRGPGDEDAETAETEKKVTFDSLGGLDKQIEKLKMCCVMPLQIAKDNASAVSGVPMPYGILLFGPTGTGKSMLAQALANELGIYTASISPHDLYSKFFGETEKKLQNVFETAHQKSPSLIIVDQMDSVCPRRDATTSDLEKRTVTTFLTLMDGLSKNSSSELCVVIGLTSKPDSIDPALRRARRFDLEIETGVPTASDRLQIMKKLLQDIPHSVSERELKHVADTTHGYVGADLAGLVIEGRQHRWKLTKDLNLEAPLTAEDLRHASKLVPPSAMREVQFEVPQVRWSDIGGQEEVKVKLRQAVEWPLTNPKSFRRLGIEPPAGCLLYGPPGCSKTMLAKALATESGLNFLAVKGPELFDKYVGESERAVREIFRKARSAAPSIIFFDEVDSLAVERGKSGGGTSVADRVLTQLLTEMDGVVQLKGVTIVAATNRPDMMDKALLRPGRFDRMVYVPLPDAATRKEILQILTRKTPVASDVLLDDLVSRTERFSGAELTAVCREAAMCAMTENVHARIVHQRHFEATLNTVHPQTTQEMIEFYERYTSNRRT